MQLQIPGLQIERGGNGGAGEVEVMAMANGTTAKHHHGVNVVVFLAIVGITAATTADYADRGNINGAQLQFSGNKHPSFPALALTEYGYVLVQ